MAPLNPPPSRVPDGREAPGARGARLGAGPRPAAAWRGLLLPLAWLLLALAGLGAAPLFDVDEGAFSEATREMLASADWLHTTLNGADRFDKPIGVYWLQALSVQVFGLNEWALRLPSALSAWGWALALWLFARRRLGGQVAALAGWLLLSCLGVLVIGRAATADALLNLLLTLAALDVWRWLEQPDPARARRAPLRRAYLWMGLGLLVKGPVALLVPGLAALGWLAFERPWPAAWQRLRHGLLDAPGWALLLGVALPWYAYALHRHGMAFVEGFFIRHNLARYAGPLEQHGGGPLYYLLVLPLLLWPWAPLLLKSVRRALQRGPGGLWADPLTRYLLLWGGAVLGFFSLSGTKLPHYALYGATPWLLLMARELPGLDGRWRLALIALMPLPLLLLCGLPVALAQGWLVPQQLVRQPELVALLTGLPVPAWWSAAGLAGALVWGWALWQARGGRQPGQSAARRQPPCAPQGMTQESTPWQTRWAPVPAALAVALLTLALPLPWWAEALQGPVQRAGLLARTQPGTAVQWGLHQPSFAFYRQVPAPRRAPLPGELALVSASRLAGRDPAGWQELHRERGLVLLRWRGAEPVSARETDAALPPAAPSAGAKP